MLAWRHNNWHFVIKSWFLVSWLTLLPQRLDNYFPFCSALVWSGGARLGSTLYSPLGRFLPSPGHLCLGQTTAGRTEVPCQERRWVSWSFWSAPCSGDQDSDLRGNRRSSRPQWRRWGDSWNNRWMFSTVWCCSVSCLAEKEKVNERAEEGRDLHSS